MDLAFCEVVDEVKCAHTGTHVLAVFEKPRPPLSHLWRPASQFWGGAWPARSIRKVPYQTKYQSIGRILRRRIPPELCILLKVVCRENLGRIDAVVL
jgi:hypothetical protein